MNPEERIVSWLKGNKRGPYSLEIRPTGRCNLNCLSCGIHVDSSKKKSKKNQKEVTTERYFELIKEASELDVKTILISGGEPFVRKDLLELMLKIKENNITGEIITNGTLLNKNIIESLVKSSWDKIIISLDAPNRKVNDYLRTKSFDTIIKNIKLINCFKKKYKASKPELIIATILSNKNYNLLFRILKLCRKLRTIYFILQELLMRSDKCKELQLNSEQREIFNSNLPKLINYAKKLDINTNLNSFLNNIDKAPLCEGDFRCFAPFFDLSILESGEVRYCIISPETLENINGKSLKSIWFGKEMDNFRNKLLKRQFPDFCKNCCSPRMFDMKRINKIIRNNKNFGKIDEP